MNYSELTAAIKGYAENDFPSTAGSFTSAQQIATFVRGAEERIYNSVQIPALRKNVTGAFTTGNKYLATPGDWLATFSIAVIDGDDYLYLLNKDVNFIRESFPSTAASERALPKYYALFDQNTFIVGPTPDEDYSVELHYFYYPDSIVDVGTSWLGENFESLLLYASLLEAAAFMKEETDVIANYQNRYNEAMALLKQLGEGKNRQDSYRTPQTRYPIK